jgi:hypothetical protein
MPSSENLLIDENGTGEQLHSTFIQMEGESLHTDGGLLVTLPGFRFNVAVLPLGAESTSLEGPIAYFFFFDVNPKGWYAVRYTVHSGDQP